VFGLHGNELPCGKIEPWDFLDFELQVLGQAGKYDRLPQPGCEDLAFGHVGFMDGGIPSLDSSTCSGQTSRCLRKSSPFQTPMSGRTASACWCPASKSEYPASLLLAPAGLNF
jgi:hypothetical protein